MLKSSIFAAATQVVAALFAVVPAHAASEAVAYSFKGGNDGAYPNASLVNVHGTLYGTTLGGGGTGCGGLGCGTVFKISKGVESVVYAFTGGSDGSSPAGDLVDVNGTLYGTASSGGLSEPYCDVGVNNTTQCGTVFSIAPDGTESTIHQFRGTNNSGSSDGSNPDGGLTKVRGTLYGTTSGGGAEGLGTIFYIDAGGGYGIIYSPSKSSSGEGLVSNLLAVGNTLYGTAVNGGKGHGTVFWVKIGGRGKTLYDFKGGNDGSNPFSGLINVGGTFYGTTVYSGGGIGAGTVYSITPKGKEQVVYALQGGDDGAFVFGGLVDVSGILYGTTYSGGPGDSGTVFSVTTAGDHTVLYTFKGSPDGSGPCGGLIAVGTKLYGTTYGGGSGGYGTVFWVQP